jgi:uncharacterized protein YlxW (UPF0749 family)
MSTQIKQVTAVAELQARYNALVAKREELNVKIEAARVEIVGAGQREIEAREAKLREAGTAQLNAIAAGAAAAEAEKHHILQPAVSIQRGARLV